MLKQLSILKLVKLSSATKNVLIALFILVFFLFLFAYFQATKPQPIPVEVKQKVWPVNVVSVAVQNVYPEQVLFGTVESSALVSITSPVAGKISVVNIKPGNLVKQGDILLALSDADLNIPVEIARADVVDISSQLALQSLSFKFLQQKLQYEQELLALRESDLNRNKELVAKKLSSDAVVDKSKESFVRQKLVVINTRLLIAENKAKTQQLQARLAKSKANQNQAKLNAKRGVVVAPFDARVSKLNVAVGDTVSMGSPLLSFYGLSSLELRAKIPKNKVREVYQAQLLGQKLTARFYVQNEVFELPLTRLAGESSTSGLDAYFSIPKDLAITRPGDLLKIHLKGAVVSDGIALPFSALHGSNKVYVVKDGLLESRKVEIIGEALVDKVAKVLVRGNLSSGEHVLTTPLPNAIGGLRVEVVK
ncbi:MAG TPA: secretion protein HlyD [Thiomicrospira sp.]|jgi:multidrug efflux pump subunit AcrA (membrane-fusion protein)|nr:secretion protein HlyD [Thiomicrospira sp.]